MNTKKISEFLQPILWSNDIHKLDLEKDKNYIIHQVLAFGGIDAWQWLFKTYSKTEIISIFSSIPYKDYSAARYNLVKNHLLNLEDYQLNSLLYVRNTPRNIGYQTTRNI